MDQRFLVLGGLLVVVVELVFWFSAMHYRDQAQDCFSRQLFAVAHLNYHRAFNRLLWCVATLALLCAVLMYLVAV
jgi:hypothetical protein